MWYFIFELKLVNTWKTINKIQIRRSITEMKYLLIGIK